jgi:caffeoyl-CoA O-methyltransferase
MTTSYTKAYSQADPRVVQYAYEVFKPEDEVLKQVRQAAEAKQLPPIQVGAFDALHLEVLARMANAKRAVEIGTLCGYSGVALARALGVSGKLHTFEIDPIHAEAAQKAFLKADLDAEVVVHVGPAIENLRHIESEGPFDLVFIDADKVSYPKYLAWADKNLRIGGVVIADNTFAWGDIHQLVGLDPERTLAVQALREFNRTVVESQHYRATILPTSEGLTVAVRIA